MTPRRDGASGRILSRQFPELAAAALADRRLRTALDRLEPRFTERRQAATRALPEFRELQEQSIRIRKKVLKNLDFYLERFAAAAEARGSVVHWARTATDVRTTVLDICRRHNVRSVVKSKSMVTEETGLADFLEAAGITTTETDLGEYIIQLAGERPSHIIAPAIHKTLDEVQALFRHHHSPRDRTAGTPEALVAEARGVLRDRYFEAGAGITGANFLVAETGSVVVVTNEGNADLSMTVPPLHIVVTSIEKVVPTLEDTAGLLRLLARSATGQTITSYTSLVTGPRRPGDPDGPGALHIVLLDGGRSELPGTDMEDTLLCIRCGACMNACPVYQATGGHAYGWVYPGPIGAVLNPLLIGQETAFHLPQASTFCGRCEEACPLRIELPRMLRVWRMRAHAGGIGPALPRLGIVLWRCLALSPWLYRPLSRLAAWLAVRAAALPAGSRRRRLLERTPLLSGWLRVRELPSPEGGTFLSRLSRSGAGERP